MEAAIYYELDSQSLPILSAADIVSIKPPYIHFRRNYPEYILYYILEGEMYLSEDTVDYVLKKNDFILLDPGRTHYGTRQMPACRFLYVHFQGHLTELTQLPANETPDAAGVPHPCDCAPLPADYKLPALLLPKYGHVELQENIIPISRLKETLLDTFHGQMKYDRLQAACHFYELLLTLAKDYSLQREVHSVSVRGKARLIIPELIRFLNQCYAEDISGELIQQHFNYHFDYLNRQFKKWTGQTIFQYLNMTRITRARQLLLTGYYTIDEVAAQTGFCDVYYFSKVFKKHTGITPGKYSAQAAPTALHIPASLPRADS